MDLAIDQGSPRVRPSLGKQFAELGLKTVQNIAESADLLASRRYGRIVTEHGSLAGVSGRWIPHQANMLQVWWDKRFRPCRADRCEIYYDAHLFSPGFITLSYIRSGPGTRLNTLYSATLVLDEIARIRRANAIVCNLTNTRVSDRLMKRWGWEEHCLEWSGRHFIKRFYGQYPDIKPVWRQRLTMD